MLKLRFLCLAFLFFLVLGRAFGLQPEPVPESTSTAPPGSSGRGALLGTYAADPSAWASSPVIGRSAASAITMAPTLQPLWDKPSARVQQISSYDIQHAKGVCKLLMCTGPEAKSSECHAYIKEHWGLTVKAIFACAGKLSPGDFAKYPPGVEVVEMPVYHKGNKRDIGLDMLMQAVSNCRADECILVHCNNSFHRGPVVTAAVMVRSGTVNTPGQAWDSIMGERIIYAGHTLPSDQWRPDQWQGKDNIRHSQNLVEAHGWLEGVRRHPKLAFPRSAARGAPVAASAAAAASSSSDGAALPRSAARDPHSSDGAALPRSAARSVSVGRRQAAQQQPREREPGQTEAPPGYHNLYSGGTCLQVPNAVRSSKSDRVQGAAAASSTPPTSVCSQVGGAAEEVCVPLAKRLPKSAGIRGTAGLAPGTEIATAATTSGAPVTAVPHNLEVRGATPVTAVATPTVVKEEKALDAISENSEVLEELSPSEPPSCSQGSAAGPPVCSQGSAASASETAAEREVPPAEPSACSQGSPPVCSQGSAAGPPVCSQGSAAGASETAAQREGEGDFMAADDDPDPPFDASPEEVVEDAVPDDASEAWSDEDAHANFKAKTFEQKRKIVEGLLLGRTSHIVIFISIVFYLTNLS